MPTENVVVAINGAPHPYVRKVSITLGATESVRSAQVETAEPDQVKRAKPGDDVVITANGSPVLTGYVRDREPDTRKDDRIVHLTIESKTADLAESAAMHKTGREEKKPLDQAGTAFAKGIAAKIRAEGKLEPIPEVVMNPGERVFDLLDRYARSQSLYITDDEKGDQVLFKGKRGRHSGTLIFPGNVVAAREKTTERTKFSKTTVRGQDARKWSKGALRSEATAEDKTVKRHRPELVLHEGDADLKRLKERAKFDQDRGAGISAVVKAELDRWRDDGGRIWTPAYLVAWVSAEIQSDLIVNSVTLAWDKSGGTTAGLDLRDPRAFGEGAGGKSDASFDFPEGDPTLTIED